MAHRVDACRKASCDCRSCIVILVMCVPCPQTSVLYRSLNICRLEQHQQRLPWYCIYWPQNTCCTKFVSVQWVTFIPHTICQVPRA